MTPVVFGCAEKRMFFGKNVLLQHADFFRNKRPMCRISCEITTQRVFQFSNVTYENCNQRRRFKNCYGIFLMKKYAGFDSAEKMQVFYSKKCAATAHSTDFFRNQKKHMCKISCENNDQKRRFHGDSWRYVYIFTPSFVRNKVVGAEWMSIKQRIVFGINSNHFRYSRVTFTSQLKRFNTIEKNGSLRRIIAAGSEEKRIDWG